MGPFSVRSTDGLFVGAISLVALAGVSQPKIKNDLTQEQATLTVIRSLCGAVARATISYLVPFVSACTSCPPRTALLRFFLR